MDYVRDAWYVASWSHEIKDRLIRITIMGENIVLFRSRDGIISALEDRCPHKSLPLSRGRIIDDAIQCGYHGMTFGSDGKCIRIPGQDNIPETAFVKTYLIAEEYNIVWIWMGDPEAIDREPPDVAYQVDKDWSFITGYMEVAANWILIRALCFVQLCLHYMHILKDAH